MDDHVLRRVIALRCPVNHAFHAFVSHTDLWWPRHHRRTPAATMVFEPRTDGRLLERSADGDEWILGRLTRFEPPSRLEFHWFPGSPGAPTQVSVTFRAVAGGSEIDIVHQALSAEAIDLWPTRVALFERGWDTVLPALASFIDIERQPRRNG